MAAPPELPVSEPILVEGDISRLDVFLVTQTGRSRMFLKEQIEAGNVTINGTPCLKTSSKVRPGDRVSFRFKEAAPADLEPVDGSLAILFEDESLLVINKRQGDVVHPGAGHRGHTLVNYLLHHLRDVSTFAEQGTGENAERPGIVHRLDRGTSGVMIVAKSRQVQETLSRQFKDRLVKKEYEAVVWGKPGDRSIWRSSIGRDPNDRKKMSSKSERGRDSVTRWERQRAFQHFAHLVLFPHTGRTHQIRVHCAEAGFPIVGDSLYGRNKTPVRLRGLDEEIANLAAALPETLLHARALTFLHPLTQKEQRIEAARPDAFTQFLELLERKDA